MPVMNQHGGRLGETLSRRSLRLGAVFVAVSAAITVAVQANVGSAQGDEFTDEPLSWEVALDNTEPSESYDPIPDYLQDFPWTWQERASQAAGLIRDTYPDDFSWFEFAQGRPGARIGFTGEVPEGAAETIDTLRSYGEDVEVFDEQTFDEHELLAANLYLTAAAQEASATTTSVAIELGDSPVIRVSSDKSEADAIGKILAGYVAVVAEEIGYPALKELPVEFEAPLDTETTDPVYDGMVLGPQAYGDRTSSA